MLTVVVKRRGLHKTIVPQTAGSRGEQQRPLPSTGSPCWERGSRHLKPFPRDKAPPADRVPVCTGRQAEVANDRVA